MSRIFPIAVLVLATLLGGGAGMLSTAGLRRAVALPEGAEAEREATVAARGTPTRGATLAQRTPSGPTDQQYLKTLLCRNLFDPSKVGQCTFQQPSAEALEDANTDLNVVLLGTLVAVPASYSSALIVEEGQERPVGYSLHDKIGDAEIVAIEKKLVRLRRGDGREEVLRMDEEGPSPQPRTTASAPSEEPTDGVEKLGENKFAVSSELLDRYLSDLEGLAGMGRALLHRGPDGEFDGYRLSAIRRNTIADQLGIRNGDIVHTVNGKPLNSMTSAMEAYNTLQNEKAFSFEVTRRGQKMTMEYEVR